MDKTRVVEGFTVVDANYLLALKLYTLAARGRAPKGRKDFLDILSLFLSRVVDGGRVTDLLRQYQMSNVTERLGEFLFESRALPELALTVHSYARLKRTITEQL